VKPEIKEATKQLCSKGAGKMRAALTPIEAGAANRALTGSQNSHVDAEIRKLALTLASDRDGAVIQHDQLTSRQPCE